MSELSIVIMLVLFNAFFALSEMAVITSRKARLKQLAATSRGARSVRNAPLSSNVTVAPSPSWAIFRTGRL